MPKPTKASRAAKARAKTPESCFKFRSNGDFACFDEGCFSNDQPFDNAINDDDDANSIDDYDYDRDYIFYDNDEEENIDVENDESNEVKIEDFDDLVNEAKKWKATGSNFGIRNFGTSRSTFYVKRNEQNKLKEVATVTGQQKMTDFLQQASSCNDGNDDNDDIYDLILKCEECNMNDSNHDEITTCDDNYPKRKKPASSSKYSRSDAIENLLKEEAKVTRDVYREKKMGLAHHEVIQAMAILRYFQKMEDGENKTEASENVAQNLYQPKVKQGSYKSRCIRRWADHYLETGNKEDF